MRSVWIRRNLQVIPMVQRWTLNTCEFFSPLHLFSLVIFSNVTHFSHITHNFTIASRLFEKTRWRRSCGTSFVLRGVTVASLLFVSLPLAGTSDELRSTSASRSAPKCHERSDVGRRRQSHCSKNSASPGGRSRQRLGPSVRGFGGSAVITRRSTGIVEDRSVCRERDSRDSTPCPATPVNSYGSDFARAADTRPRSTGVHIWRSSLKPVAEAGVPRANFTSFAERSPSPPSSTPDSTSANDSPDDRLSFPKQLSIASIPDFQAKGRRTVASAKSVACDSREGGHHVAPGPATVDDRRDTPFFETLVGADTGAPSRKFCVTRGGGE